MSNSDNTKDPVRVLRDQIAALKSKYTPAEDFYGLYNAGFRAAKDIAVSLVERAAIPHSEQRETVAAGEAVVLTGYKGSPVVWPQVTWTSGPLVEPRTGVKFSIDAPAPEAAMDAAIEAYDKAWNPANRGRGNKEDALLAAFRALSAADPSADAKGQ